MSVMSILTRRPMRMRAVGCAVLCLLMLGSTAPLAAQRGEPGGSPPPRDDRGPPPRDSRGPGGPPPGDFRGPGGPPPGDFRGPGGGPPPFRSFDGPTEATSKQGYVFVNGEYLPPPYDIRLTDNGLTVNGKQLDVGSPGTELEFAL